MNFTFASTSVGLAFQDSGDIGRSNSIKYVGDLLEKGVKVALVYGDRDFACNWVGGETMSLAIEYEGSDEFAAAGYTPIFTDEGVEGGQVRQSGNYSFSRVYQAGHLGMQFSSSFH